MVLESEVFRHLEPGLSSYKDDPEKGAHSLVPLLEAAMHTVPKELQSTTPINLKATAGNGCHRDWTKKSGPMKLIYIYIYIYIFARIHYI